AAPLLPRLVVTEACPIVHAQVVVDGVAMRAEPVLDAVALEVRLDAGGSHLGMEHREYETPRRHQARVELAKESGRPGEMFADESAHRGVEGSRANRERLVQVGLRHRER